MNFKLCRPKISSNSQVILLAFFAWALCGTTPLSAQSESASNDPQNRVLSVDATQLHETSSFQVSRQFTGQIETRRKSQLGFDRIGRITEFYVDRGEEVVKGQPLALLDCEALLAQRSKLEADLESSQAVLREAQVGPRKETIDAARAAVEEQRAQFDQAVESLHRRERLISKKLIAREEYDQAVANHKRLKASVEGAESRLKEMLEGTRVERIDAQMASVSAIYAAIEQVNVEIKKSKLLSPFDGQVVAREFNEGSIVSPGRQVITIVEHQKLEARVGVPQKFLKNIVKGERIQLDCNGDILNAKVFAVLSEVDSSTRTQPVILHLDDDAWQKVIPGDTVRVAFKQEKQAQGFWVPTECLIDGPRGLWNCFVVENIGPDGIGTVKAKTVEIVHSAGEKSLISGSVKEGDILVTSAPHRIIAGQAVRPSLETSPQ